IPRRFAPPPSKGDIGVTPAQAHPFHPCPLGPPGPLRPLRPLRPLGRLGPLRPFLRRSATSFPNAFASAREGTRGGENPHPRVPGIQKPSSNSNVSLSSLHFSS